MNPNPRTKLKPELSIIAGPCLCLTAMNFLTDCISQVEANDQTGSPWNLIWCHLVHSSGLMAFPSICRSKRYKKQLTNVRERLCYTLSRPQTTGIKESGRTGAGHQQKWEQKKQEVKQDRNINTSSIAGGDKWNKVKEGKHPESPKSPKVAQRIGWVRGSPPQRIGWVRVSPLQSSLGQVLCFQSVYKFLFTLPFQLMSLVKRQACDKASKQTNLS